MIFITTLTVILHLSNSQFTIKILFTLIQHQQSQFGIFVQDPSLIYAIEKINLSYCAHMLLHISQFRTKQIFFRNS